MLTVEGEVRRVLSRSLVCAGRTDGDVSALSQVEHQNSLQCDSGHRLHARFSASSPPATWTQSRWSATSTQVRVRNRGTWQRTNVSAFRGNSTPAAKRYGDAISICSRCVEMRVVNSMLMYSSYTLHCKGLSIYFALFFVYLQITADWRQRSSLTVH